MSKTLLRGGVARVYRPGGGFGDCQGVYNVPFAGAFMVRDLPPGEYVARDEAGNEVAFVQQPGEEQAVVFGSGAPAEGTGGPGDADMISETADANDGKGTSSAGNARRPKKKQEGADGDKPGSAKPRPQRSSATKKAQARQTKGTDKVSQSRPEENKAVTREAVGQGVPNTEVVPEGHKSNTGDGGRRSTAGAKQVADETSVAGKAATAGTAAAAKATSKRKPPKRAPDAAEKARSAPETEKAKRAASASKKAGQSPAPKH